MHVTFTDRELDVMAVLWTQGASTVADVRDRLDDPLAYTTVLSVLRTLEAKGYVGHVEEGRAHRYHPLVAVNAQLPQSELHARHHSVHGALGPLIERG